MGNDRGNEAGDRDGAEGASGTERLTAPPDDARRPRLPFPVVGVGASAGGLEAYTEFLRACPADPGMAFVFVQHLPPDRESMLVELLARQTHMPVLEVEDGRQIEPDHVYVIRPGHTLTVRDGRLRLGPVLAARGHGRPVDDFFRSLAEEQQQRAVAVVFSGMGSNGTAGAQAVKAVGGLVIAQEPESAKFPGMPRSLIDAHLPDYILRPSEVPEALIRYASQPYAAGDGGEPTPRDEQVLADVLAVLRARTRHDFAGYRKPTLLRRVRRRMGLGQFASMVDYVRALRQTPAEVAALADDLLIHVTGFFRDPEAWEALREKVVDPLAVERSDGAEVRCWVAACATGEEAYSLAMLLVEAAEARGKRFDVKVFATDMAERALGSARSGAFPNGIESEVSPERLARFFDRDDSFYRVKKELRELVIFAPQNILQDPPFSRLDIGTCRNLLIYLEPVTQRRVLALMHFGLREGGCLMLGTSESASLADGDFEPIDKKYRLFRRVGPTRAGTLDLPALVNAAREFRPTLAQAAAPPAPQAAAQLVVRALLDRHTPAAVAVDAAGQIVHVHGDTSRYLALPSGSPTLDLLAMANDQVRGPVRAALHRAAESHLPVVVRDGLIDTPEGRRRVEVGAAPLGFRGGPPLYLVTFRDYPEPPPPAPAEAGESTVGELADELQRVKNELQGALEEMQSSNEELKASHEEATSLNEELQSTNEELETSKEEMQSLNEELVTVNAQLQAKMGELEATANDLGSLLTSTDIAVLFLDPKFRIRRFTPAVRDLLELIPSDVGRPFVDLRLKFDDPELLADARRVLDRLVPVERAVASESGRHYLRRILPYRTQDDRIDGVVVAFVDVTERRKADDAVRANAAWLVGQKQAFQSALNGEPLEASLGSLIRAAVDSLGEGARAAFYLSDDRGETLRHVVGMPPEYAEAVESFRIGPESLACGLATATGKPVITPDVMEDPRWETWRSMAERFDYRGCWSFPIYSSSGVFVGAFAVYWRRPRAATARDLELASLMTDAAAIIISRNAESGARRQAEAASRESESRLRLALAAARMGIWTLDADSGEQMRDANLNRLLGLEPVESTQPFEEFLAHIHPEDAAAVRAAFDRSMREGRPLSLEFRVVLPDGSARWLRDQGDVFGDAAAGARNMAGACVDVTERREAEEALKDSEERLRLILESATDFAIFTMTPDRVVTTWSPGAQAAFGYAAGEMIGRSADALFTPEDREAGVPEVEGARRDGRSADERWHLRKDGMRFYASGVMSPLRDGGDVGFVKVARDLTERKRMEDALREARGFLEGKVEERTAELVATLGSLEAEMERRRDLARRLATAQEDERRRVSRDLHDSVGQLMAGLSLALKSVEAAGELPPASAARLAEARRVLDALGREVHGLAVRLRPTVLDDVGLEPALGQLVSDWSERTEIEAAFQASAIGPERLAPEVETAIYRIVQEALTNVAKHAKASAVSVVLSRSDGHVTVVVEDDGVGFVPDAAPKGRLGLLGMRERTALVGGELDVESSPGGGTAVRVRILASMRDED